MDYGYLEFKTRADKEPSQYPLVLGQTTIGNELIQDIRIKSKSISEKSTFCSIEVQENGRAILEKQTQLSIECNGRKVKTFKVLKNGDIFVVAGKTFKYTYEGGVPGGKINKRISLMSDFKVTSLSRIPVPSRSLRTPRSLSESKLKIQMRKPSSCHSAVPNRRRTNLDVAVRRSLFLKNNQLNQIELNEEFSPKRMSLRGVKRALESSTPITRKKVKLSEQSLNSEASFNDTNNIIELTVDSTVSIVSSNENISLNYSESSILQDSFTSDDGEKTADKILQTLPYEEADVQTSLGTSKPQSSFLSSYKNVEHVSPQSLLNTSQRGRSVRLSKTPKSQKSPLNSYENVRGVKKLMRTPKPQNSPLNSYKNVSGTEQLLGTPKPPSSSFSSYENVHGVEELLKTAMPQKTLTVKSAEKLIKRGKPQKSQLNKYENASGVKKWMKIPRTQKSPQSSYENVQGIKMLLRTPKPQNSPLNTYENVRGIKKLMKTPKPQKSPHNSYENVKGVKKLLKTPKIPRSPLNSYEKVDGIAELFKTPKFENTPTIISSNVKTLMKAAKPQKSPLNTYENVRGVKKLMSTPQPQKSPFSSYENVKGVKMLLRTPKPKNSPRNSCENVDGVEKLLKTPKPQKNLSIISTAEKSIETEKPQNSSHDLEVKRVLRTPKPQSSPLNSYEDVEQLLNTPEPQQTCSMLSENEESVKKIIKTPKPRKSSLNIYEKPQGSPQGTVENSPNAMSLRSAKNVDDFEKSFTTPKPQNSSVITLENVKSVEKFYPQKSPLNSYENVKGVKHLMTTPRPQNSPLNTYEDIRGVKKLLKTPKLQNSPFNTYENVSGVKKLMQTPKPQNSPFSSYENVAGVKKLFGTRKLQHSPLNTYENVRGVKKLMRTRQSQKSPLNTLENISGLKRLFKMEKHQKSPNNDLRNVSGLAELFAESKQESVKEMEKSLSPIVARKLRSKKQKNELIEEPVEPTTMKEIIKQQTAPKVTRRGRQKKIEEAAVENDIIDEPVVQSIARRLRGKKASEEVKEASKAPVVRKRRGPPKKNDESHEEVASKHDSIEVKNKEVRWKKVDVEDSAKEIGTTEVLTTQKPTRRGRVKRVEEINQELASMVEERPKRQKKNTSIKQQDLSQTDESILTSKKVNEDITDSPKEISKTPQKTTRRGRPKRIEEVPEEATPIIEEGPKFSTSRKRKSKDMTEMKSKKSRKQKTGEKVIEDLPKRYNTRQRGK